MRYEELAVALTHARTTIRDAPPWQLGRKLVAQALLNLADHTGMDDLIAHAAAETARADRAEQALAAALARKPVT